MLNPFASNSPGSALTGIKVVHTVVWAFFAACIVAIPVLGWYAQYVYAVLFMILVGVEVLVLVINGWKCPLTSLAEHYTNDRRDNFDIYLPEWLARHNKTIFGTLYVAGILVTIARWANIFR